MIARFWLWFSMTYNMNITEKAYDCSSGQIDHFFETEDVDIVLAGEGVGTEHTSGTPSFSPVNHSAISSSTLWPLTFQVPHQTERSL